MTYTIKETAKQLGIPESTIRYYDKTGLLPGLQRLDSGYRVFTDEDMHTLELIQCFKATGMKIQEIQAFFELCKQGDKTINDRYQFFLNRKQNALKQLEDLKKQIDLIDYKIDFYRQKLEN